MNVLLKILSLRFYEARVTAQCLNTMTNKLLFDPLCSREYHYE